MTFHPPLAMAVTATYGGNVSAQRCQGPAVSPHVAGPRQAGSKGAHTLRELFGLPILDNVAVF
jgi:hypothetical protein